MSVAVADAFDANTSDGRFLMTQPDDQTREGEARRMMLYGFVVVVIGIGVTLCVYLVAVAHWKSASDVATAAGSVSGVIGTLVGAFFGIHIGSAGKARAEAARDRAESDRHAEALKVQRLAAAGDPETVQAILGEIPR
jgi:hypothetical protein